MVQSSWAQRVCCPDCQTANRCRGVENLPLEIREVHHIAVDEADRPIRPPQDTSLPESDQHRIDQRLGA